MKLTPHIDPPIQRLRRYTLLPLLRSISSLLHLPDFRPRRETRIQQDDAEAVRHGPHQGRACRICPWRTVFVCVHLGVQVGGGSVCAVVDGVFVCALGYVIFRLFLLMLWFFCRISFQLIMIIIYPNVIQPLFNTLSPLKEGDLRTRIEALASKLKFPLKHLYEIDGSKRSSHSNAYFFGLPWVCCILAFD